MNEPTSYGLQPPAGTPETTVPAQSADGVPGPAGEAGSGAQAHAAGPANAAGAAGPGGPPGPAGQGTPADQVPPADEVPPAGGTPPGRTPPADQAGGAAPPGSGERARPDGRTPRDAAAARQQPRLLGGRYRLTGRLGHGGMGTVWLAHDERVGRDVAVKEPRVPEQLPERERANVYQRMRREARAAARIDHPSVVAVHDVVIEDEQPWLVMELVRGESLAEVLDSGTLDSREAARIGLHILGALTAAHESGVLHRDVKPANVLLGRHDRVVLTDFGIAQVEGEQGLTETGAFVGSPEYIAPERALGQRPGPESDLWSLGVLLYVAVEGVSPFRRNNTAATLQAVLSAEPQRPARADGALGMLIMRLLRKEPGARPDAAEVRRELEAIAKPPPPPPPTQVAPTRVAFGGAATGRRLLPRGRRARASLAGGLLAVLVLVAAVVVFRPFSGDLPEGWERQVEEELGVSWAIPAGYQKDEPDEEFPNRVRYTSPDHLYQITVWHNNPDERDALTAASDYRNLTQEWDRTYVEIDGRFYQKEFDGLDAAETMVMLRPWGEAGTEEEAAANPREASVNLFVVAPRNEQIWHIQVRMPGEDGPAKEHGEELYEQLLAETVLTAQKQQDPPSEDEENDL